MNKVLSGALKFFKQETVMCVAFVLAVVSCFFVAPSIEYLSYINWKTLGILLVMMIVVQVLRVLGVFDVLVGKLLMHVSTSRGLILVLVMACFFGSIFITNDVSLITFVPFAIMALRKAEFERLIVPTVALQTIAANMGCMLLPIGAPHNIYMYSVSGIPFGSFILLLLPFVVVSFVFLVIVCCLIPSHEITVPVGGAVEINRNEFWKKVFSGVDYFLLLTFIFFFILIGNLQNISAVSNFFSSLIVGHEVLCGILASQVISNVPAAMMLSGFSTNYSAIVVGVNLGGLGTLIASMANLISYKIFAKECKGQSGKYLVVFSLLNIILLGILVGIYLLVH